MARTLSIKEVAEYYGVSNRTVQDVWIPSGELKAICTSRSLTSKKKIYRITESALQEFELLRQAPSTPPRRRRKRKQTDTIQFYK